jgi:hypothetical protein
MTTQEIKDEILAKPKRPMLGGQVRLAYAPATEVRDPRQSRGLEDWSRSKRAFLVR